MAIKVHWVGPIRDSSGYANATRNYILSILKAGKEKISLSVEGVSFESVKTAHKEDHLIAPYISGDPGALIRVVHLTPENYQRYARRGAYNIGYVAWETNQIPPEWVYLCNQMSELWVPSDWNVNIFRNNGVSIPITKIPHVIQVPDLKTVSPLPCPGDDPSIYWFYAISQWTTRKNFYALLVAYLTEFTSDDPVVLSLKTYRMNTSNQEADIIKNEIKHVKRELHLPRDKYPKILFFKRLMSGSEMDQLHSRGDCFVLPCRGEGFGIPFAEAMSFGNPTIGPNYGGSAEFMDDENSYLIPCRETPVFGMSWMSHYHGRMTWGDPSILELKKIMRHVYTHRDEAKVRGEKGRQTIEQRFSVNEIGSLVCSRLLEINNKINKVGG